jgi:HAD superfamily hydrolase (TIGR01509 family)
MITTIIFDLDGLLADTEPLQMQAYQQALLLHGILLTDEQYAQHWIRAGLGIEQFVAERRLNLATSVVRQQKKQLYQELLATCLHAMPGAAELIERLHARKRLAVASCSFRADVVQVLQRLGFAGYMEVIAAREDVEQAKPAPEIFLYVAGKLKVEPSECLVLEDAEKGILAASRAGMQSIAIPNRYTRDNDFSMATYVAESLWEVEGLVDTF